MWKKDSISSLPDTMTSETEKGLAKLVCEINEGASVSEHETEHVGKTVKVKVEAGDDIVSLLSKQGPKNPLVLSRKKMLRASGLSLLV